MQKLNCKIKTAIVILLFTFLFPVSGISQHSNFLPMEDAMSAARTSQELANDNIKPYRQSFNLGNNKSANNYIDFSTTDICAFILLAGIYVMLVKRGSKSRSASF